MDKEPHREHDKDTEHDWGVSNSVGKPGKAGLRVREWGMSSFLDLLSWKESVRKIGGWERKRVFWEH